MNEVLYLMEFLVLNYLCLILLLIDFDINFQISFLLLLVMIPNVFQIVILFDFLKIEFVNKEKMIMLKN